MRPPFGLWVVSLLGIVAPVLAATPEENFEKLYGAQSRRVQASRDAKAVGEFAQSLINDAGQLKDDPKFQAVVYIKAYEIALRGGGYSIAQDAMEKLAQAQPDLRRQADEKLLLALEREHRPALRAKLDATKARVATEKRLEQLEHAVQQTPNKKDAADVVRLLLVELDDPVKAATFVAAASDAVLTRIVTLAGQPPADLPEADAKALGDWYQANSLTASPSGKAIAIGHAKVCYERFLSLHAANDESRLEVKHRLDTLVQVAAAIGKSPSATGAVDLLGLVDLSKDVVEGQWTPGPTGITSSGDRHANRIRLPYQPPAEYDVRVVLTLADEEGHVGILFSRNDASGHWTFIWAATSQARFAADHIPSSAKIVNLTAKFAAGSKHELILKVRNGSITTFVDGVPAGDITGDYSKMRDEEYWSIGAHSIGILSTPGVVTFHSVELAEISGRGMKTR